MTVVIDASVVVSALIDGGKEGQWAEEIIARGLLVAPVHLFVESANILRRLEQNKGLSALEINGAYRDLLRLDVELFPYEPFASRIWDLRHNVSSYDAWYVAVAEALNAELATLDRRLVRASGPSCRFLFPEGNARWVD